MPNDGAVGGRRQGAVWLLGSVLIGFWRWTLAGMTAFTAADYPLPSDRRSCRNDYLKLSYVCDPDTQLSHTEAEAIHRELPPAFFHCFPSQDELDSVHSSLPSASALPVRGSTVGDHHHQWTKVLLRQPFTLGIALAKTIQYGNRNDCRDDMERSFDLDREQLVKRLFQDADYLRKMAEQLRRRWRTARCTTDVLILLAEDVVSCFDGTRVRYTSGNPVYGLSFSERLKRLLRRLEPWSADQHESLMSGDDPRPSSLTSGSFSCRNRSCLSERISYLLRNLQRLTPPSGNSGGGGGGNDLDGNFNGGIDPNFGPDDLGGGPLDDLRPWHPRGQPDRWQRQQLENRSGGGADVGGDWSPKRHQVPNWAVAAFAICALVTAACFYIGHCVNSGGRGRFHAAAQSSSMAKSLHNRRWRAGFGGGMFELHQQNRPSVGGHFPAAKPSMRPATAAVRGKMFGGIGLPTRKHASAAQNSYHRV